MYIDNELLMLDDAAYGATVTVIDLADVRPGPGQPIIVFINCANGDLAGMTALTFLHDADGNADEALMVYTITAAQINANTQFIALPPTTKRYIKVALTGASAGTGITCGVVGGPQTNI